MRRLSLLLLCLSLTGCAAVEGVSETFSGISDYFSGGADNTDPPKALIDYTSELKIEVLWKESVGVGSAEQSLNLVAAIGNGKILAADRKGLVKALDLKTGNRLWEKDTEMAFSGGPGIGDGTVVLGSSDAEVIALNVDTGEQLWRTKVSSEVLSVPVIANGVVVVRTGDGAVNGLNEKTGAKLWSYEISVPALSIRGTGTPVIVDGNVIGGYDNGKLAALRLNDGKFAWETNVAMPKGRSEVERLVDLDVDPIEAAGVIYTASFQGGVSAVSAIDGEILWRNENISSHTGLSNDWRYLYLSDSDSDLWQLDQRTGSSLWKQQDLHQRNLSAPAAYDNYVVVGDFEGYVHWLNTTDGRQMARVQISSSPIETKPIVVENTVYVYTKDGTIAALTVH
ncbi:MAG: outer membrane protein assembly factor BamB [Methylovulum sp.]|jgi:outer membrane protein assembly factor BamB|nr:outer membrane protein assembly factor BamB [Methylovulum sp.]MCF7998833.1 outer membrane protein assembly factor BamB [Methylovulum sp.]